MEAVKQGSATVGLKSRTHAVLVALKVGSQSIISRHRDIRLSFNIFHPVCLKKMRRHHNAIMAIILFLVFSTSLVYHVYSVNKINHLLGEVLIEPFSMFRIVQCTDNSYFSGTVSCSKTYALKCTQRTASKCSCFRSVTKRNYWLQRAPSELSAHQKKILPIDDHVGVSIAGLTADARLLWYVDILLI